MALACENSRSEDGTPTVSPVWRVAVGKTSNKKPRGGREKAGAIKAWQKTSTRKLPNLLEKASHGRFGKEEAEQMKAAAASSFGVSFVKDTFAFQIR